MKFNVYDKHSQSSASNDTFEELFEIWDNPKTFNIKNNFPN